MENENIIFVSKECNFYQDLKISRSASGSSIKVRKSEKLTALDSIEDKTTLHSLIMSHTQPRLLLLLLLLLMLLLLLPLRRHGMARQSRPRTYFFSSRIGSFIYSISLIDFSPLHMYVGTYMVENMLLSLPCKFASLLAAVCFC